MLHGYRLFSEDIFNEYVFPEPSLSNWKVRKSQILSGFFFLISKKSQRCSKKARISKSGFKKAKLEQCCHSVLHFRTQAETKNAIIFNYIWPWNTTYYIRCIIKTRVQDLNYYNTITMDTSKISLLAPNAMKQLQSVRYQIRQIARYSIQHKRITDTRLHIYKTLCYNDYGLRKGTESMQVTRIPLTWLPA